MHTRTAWCFFRVKSPADYVLIFHVLQSAIAFRRALQVEGLKKENAVLATNISSLFKTAQLELERKGKEIAALRQSAR